MNGLPKVKAWHLSLSNFDRDPDTQMTVWNQGRQEYQKTVLTYIIIPIQLLANIWPTCLSIVPLVLG